MTSRRDVLRLALGGGLAVVAASACGRPGESTTAMTTTTTAPSAGGLPGPEPIRTISPEAPARRVIALSWAADGTGPRPWRTSPAPPSPDWDQAGPPSLRAVLPFGADAFAVASADLSESQMRAYEQLGAVIADPAGRPGWRAHLDLMADALDRDPGPVADAAARKLETWTEQQRALGVGTFVVVVATGADPDTPVATLAADSPLGSAISDLGFGILAHPGPVPFRRLRTRGVQLVRVDPRDADLVAAIRQPSVTSLPWALEQLVRGRQPG